MNQTFEIRSGSTAASLYYRPVVDYNNLTSPPTDISISFYAPDGTGSLEDVSGTWDVTDEVLKWVIDVSDTSTFEPNLCYRCDIIFTYDGAEEHRTMYLHILVDPWIPGVTTADIDTMSPDISYTELDPNNVNYTDDIRRAEDHIRIMFHNNSPRLAAGMVTDKPALDSALKNRTLHMLWAAKTDGSQDNYSKNLAQTYLDEYNDVMDKLLANLPLDTAQDLVPDTDANIYFPKLVP